MKLKESQLRQIIREELKPPMFDPLSLDAEDVVEPHLGDTEIVTHPDVKKALDHLVSAWVRTVRTGLGSNLRKVDETTLKLIRQTAQGMREDIEIALDSSASGVLRRM